MKKMMKVLLSLTLIAALALTMVACGSKAPEGKYTLKTLRVDGDEIAAADALGEGANTMFIEFNKDGTGKMGAAGQVSEITWEGNTITNEATGDSLDFELKGNAVIISDNGAEMIYEK